LRKGIGVTILIWTFVAGLWILCALIPLIARASSPNLLTLILALSYESLFEYSVSATVLGVIWTALYTVFRLREKRR